MSGLTYLVCVSGLMLSPALGAHEEETGEF